MMHTGKVGHIADCGGTFLRHRDDFIVIMRPPQVPCNDVHKIVHDNDKPKSLPCEQLGYPPQLIPLL